MKFELIRKGRNHNVYLHKQKLDEPFYVKHDDSWAHRFTGSYDKESADIMNDALKIVALCDLKILET